MRVLLVIIALFSFTTSLFAAPGDTTIIEITDANMSSVYYHQTNFAKPTKLVFKNLTTVNGYIYFHQNINLIEVDFPLLTSCDNYFYFHGNTSLKKIIAPNLNTVRQYLYVYGNTSLAVLNVCNLKQVLPDLNNPDPLSIYYLVANNTPVVDAAPLCFSIGAPTNLALTNNSINENMAVNTMIGKLSASSAPNSTLTYYVNSNKFRIRNDTLFSAGVFDYESQSQYNIPIGVINQLGEKTEQDFTININNIIGEDTVTIEIEDTILSSVYYHQNNFATPTKLVFKNLTTVNGYVYFHQNVNLASVDFPLLQSSDKYFYFHGNKALNTILAPNLTTVREYLYVYGNTSLSQLDVCNLEQILPSIEHPDPAATYYLVTNNTPAVDTPVMCFVKGAPSNLAISKDSVNENMTTHTFVGKISANVGIGSTVTYYLPDYTSDNNKFIISHDSLLTASVFDYEAKNKYDIRIGATNQLGEKTEADFIINIRNVAPEDTVIIEIEDTVMSSVYYHQVGFTNPTKLVFKNLTKANGYIYFHQNVNLVEVDFPLLTSCSSYVYFHQNGSLQKIIAPVLNTATDYVYVYGNNALTVLDICGLQKILPVSGNPTPYYFINNNSNLDYSTTCLTKTNVIYVPESHIVVKPKPNTFIGRFISDADTGTYKIKYFFVDASGVEITNDYFVIRNDSLFLTQDYEFYTDTTFSFDINAVKSTKILNRPAGASTSLNEKIALQVNTSITNTIQFSNTWIGTSTSAAKSAWENPANWSRNVLPDANTNVIINSGNITIGTNAICKSISVNPGAHVTVKSGYTLVVTN